MKSENFHSQRVVSVKKKIIFQMYSLKKKKKKISLIVQ